MIVKENSNLYKAIEEAIYDIFNCDIELIGPTETTEQFVKKVNEYLKGKQEK